MDGKEKTAKVKGNKEATSKAQKGEKAAGARVAGAEDRRQGADQGAEAPTASEAVEGELCLPEESPDNDEAVVDPCKVLTEELAQCKDQVLRLTADFENYRKRTLRDKQDWSRYACQVLFEKLLPILDGMDAAMVAVSAADKETQKIVEGFMMIQKQFQEVLKSEGLVEIEALDQTFDPNIHEAVLQGPPEAGQQDNQVVQVLRKGYLYRDKVLRAVMVKVAKA